MTIGPEPMMRIVFRSVRLGIDQIRDGLLQRNRGVPPGMSPYLAGIGDQMRRVASWVRGGHEPSVLAQFGRQHGKQLAKRYTPAGCKVVDLACLSPTEKRHVGPGDIPHIHEVPHDTGVPFDSFLPISLRSNSLVQHPLFLVPRPSGWKRPDYDNSKVPFIPGLGRGDLR